MNLDEKVYCLLNPLRNDLIEALGVKLLGRADFHVGLYYGWQVYPKNEFIFEMADLFGEARFISFQKGTPCGFATKFSVDVPYFQLLSGECAQYRQIQLALLELRASTPKPFLGLSYHKENKHWAYKPIPQLACINSNYGMIPN